MEQDSWRICCETHTGKWVMVTGPVDYARAVRLVHRLNVRTRDPRFWLKSSVSAAKVSACRSGGRGPSSVPLTPPVPATWAGHLGAAPAPSVAGRPGLPVPRLR